MNPVNYIVRGLGRCYYTKNEPCTWLRSMKIQDIQPIVSVAVITYNMAEYLPQLLDSILVQEVSFPYEIIVDDDCSPDNTREILYRYEKQYPEHIVLSLRGKNVGGSRNMFGVLRKCRGKYIAILEGDDYWDDPNKLQYQFDFMENHSQYVGMTCNSWCELSRTEVRHHPRRNITKPLVFTYDDFMKPFFFDRLPNSTDTWFFKNIFRENKENYSVFYKAHPMVWDQTLALILYGKGNIYVDPRLVSHHRTIVEENGENYQSKYARGNYCDQDARMYAYHEMYIEKILKRDCHDFYKVRAEVFAEALFRALKSESREDWKIVGRIWIQRKSHRFFFRACADHFVKTLVRRIKDFYFVR